LVFKRGPLGKGESATALFEKSPGERGRTPKKTDLVRSLFRIPRPRAFKGRDPPIEELQRDILYRFGREALSSESSYSRKEKPYEY